MKKTLSLLLVLAMVLGSFSFAFADEAKVDPAVEAGEFLKKAGVLEGSDSGDLMLDKQLKRQDAVVLLSRLMKAEEEAKKFPVTEEYPTFKDITNNYYKPYLAWAQANKYYEGHNAEKFGYGEFLTAQQYATVLLRALGYEVNDAEAYKAAFETAKKLGIMKDLKVEEKAEITRGQMAQMTFNALGLKMKGSDKTLAEFLGIEMPAPAELKVEKVYTENLKEIVVELSNAKLVDKEKLADANNYKLVGFKVEKVTVDGNNVIILLSDAKALDKNKNYELVVRNVDKAINGTHKFKAEDNTIPAVEKVEVLGEYGIKVTTTEPVKIPPERSFLVDGKNIAMVVEQYGRVIILTPYHDKAFPENAKKLTVKGLEDYAGFKSVAEDFEISIVKDEVAPEVVDVLVRGNEVEVVFDKDIYADSISGYLHGKATGNISYKDGRHTIYTKNEYYETGSDKKDINRVVYYFEKEIPRRAEFTIEGVANHSNVAMKAVTMAGREVQDYSEPEILKSELWDYTRGKDGESTAVVRVHFDKDVEGIYVNRDNKALGFKPLEHFDLYVREVTRRNLLTEKTADYDKFITSVNYVDAGKATERKDVIEVKLAGLNVNTLEKDFDYVLEVRNFTDTTSFRNKMYRDYAEFSIPKAGTAFKVTDIRIAKENDVETEIAISFNKAVDRELAENLTNYLFTAKNGVKYDVKQLDGDIIVERDGKTVTIVLPGFKAKKANYTTLEVLQSIKDIYGARLIADNTIFDLHAEKIVNPPAEDVEIANFKEAHKEVLELKVADVKSADHKGKVSAALTAYDKLSEKAQAGLKDEKAHLDALAAEIAAQDAATAPLTLVSAKETVKPVKATSATPAVFTLTHKGTASATAASYDGTLLDGDKVTVGGVTIEITTAKIAALETGSSLNDVVTIQEQATLDKNGIAVALEANKLTFTNAEGNNFNWKVETKAGVVTEDATVAGKLKVGEVQQVVEVIFNKDMSGVVKVGDTVKVNGTITAKVTKVSGKVVEIETTGTPVATGTVISTIDNTNGIEFTTTFGVVTVKPSQAVTVEGATTL